jgi:hypothetical protein
MATPPATRILKACIDGDPVGLVRPMPTEVGVLRYPLPEF